MQIFLLALAGIFSGIAQTINKSIVARGYDAKALTVVIMLTNALLAIPLLFYQFEVTSSILYWGVVLLSTISFAFCVYFSFRAYAETDISVVSIIYRLNIVLIAIAGIVFLRESYSILAYTGLFLIFFSGVMFAFKGNKLQITPGILFALLMAVFGAIASVLDKVILNEFSPYTYAFVNNLFIGMVFAFNPARLRTGIQIFKQEKLPVFFTALFNLAAFVVVLVVLENTDVSRTLPIHKAFALISPVLIGVFLLNEKDELWKKLIGVGLGILGITLLY